jgi:hypothetical protein
MGFFAVIFAPEFRHFRPGPYHLAAKQHAAAALRHPSLGSCDGA